MRTRSFPRPALTLTTAALLGMLAAVARPSGAAHDRTHRLAADNRFGRVRTVSAGGAIDLDNPFFRELGTNGRTCFTCHRPAEAWSITPASVRARFDESRGLDPIFRTNDGSNCDGADVSTVARRRRAYSLLLDR